jgi:outer membrane protein TolC
MRVPGGCLVWLALLPGHVALAQGAQEAGQALPSVQAGSAGGTGANPLMGGVPSGPSTSETLRLTLADALSRGLSHNLAAILGREGVVAAGGARLAALSGLLPTVAGRVSETREVVNLEAYGFPLPAGMNPIVGPFNVFDARVSVTQSIFDLSAIGAARAGAQAASAAEASYADARGAVVVVCANLYLRAVIGGGLVYAVRAQLRTAEALHARAVDMKAAGVVPGIDVLRAEVQLQAQRQRLIVAENDLAKQKLALARAIGLPLEQPFELVDPAPYAALAAKPLPDLLAEAFDRRSDLKSAVATLQAAEASRQATVGEALPSLRFNADYGDMGKDMSTSKPTYAVGVQLRVPLFQGGRVRARLQQVDAGLAAERARLADLRGRIEYEVRTACLDLAAADERVKVARRAVELSDQQLAQAQDRFTAGVANNLEVVQAQETVAAATDSYLLSLYAHNLAKLSLARALGVAEEAAGQYLGGLR